MIVDRNKKIGICSPSWSGAGKFPYVFNCGVNNIKEIFGMDVVISKNARRDDFVSFSDRASDINSLFRDNSIGFICASIGGDDSVGVLPYLDLELIKNNRKPFMGFSDTTNVLLYLKYKCDVQSIHGPSVMAGFAEPSGIDSLMIRAIEELFFEDCHEYIYKDYDYYTDEDNDWASEASFITSRPFKKKYEGWHISNHGKVEGVLFGGSIESLEKMKKTEFFPFDLDFWNNKILFLETSEEKPSLSFILNELDDYHQKGILSRINCLMFGQLAYYTQEEKSHFFEEIEDFLIKKLGHKRLVVIQNMNFGHVRPQWILLMGSKIEIDTRKHLFKVVF